VPDLIFQAREGVFGAVYDEYLTHCISGKVIRHDRHRSTPAIRLKQACD